MIENNVIIEETQGLVKGVTYDTEPDKTYLILIDGENNDAAYRDWEIVIGRQAAYDYIKNLLESSYASINVQKSKIIVDSDKVKISDGVSIYKFMKSMKEQDKIIDYTSFDIDDYINDEDAE